ncbi:MAG: hypothetical protein K2X80_07900 [Pseudomonadaceae bacterium]|nr:hypothetical protein [Pseudomonadaceae bacterium]
MKWRQKLDRDGAPIKDCWLSDDGYTVALCRLPEKRYTITRPGGSAPFAYTGERDDVPLLIEADIEASAALVRAGRPA